MKANGNALVVPNILKGQARTAEMVKAISKTTHLYIRALKPTLGTNIQPQVAETAEHLVPPPPSIEDFDSSDLDDFDITPHQRPSRTSSHIHPLQNQVTCYILYIVHKLLSKLMCYAIPSDSTKQFNEGIEYVIVSFSLQEARCCNQA